MKGDWNVVSHERDAIFANIGDRVQPDGHRSPVLLGRRIVGQDIFRIYRAWLSVLTQTVPEPSLASMDLREVTSEI